MPGGSSIPPTLGKRTIAQCSARLPGDRARDAVHDARAAEAHARQQAEMMAKLTTVQPEVNS
jgi:hypothetical protein